MANNTVLITGANGCIGRALIKKFAAEGFNIIAHMREEKPDFLTFSYEIEIQYKVRIKTLYFDLENENEIKIGILSLKRDKCSIDVLVNNAGVEHGGLLQMTPLAQVKRVFDVNLFSAIQITQLISRLMSKQGYGVIVNIASVAGIDLEAGNIAYGVSKAALIAFTKTAAKELASQNIRVNAVAPGLTDSRMASMMDKKAGTEMVQKSSFKRLAKPEEIADAVYYLSSGNSSFVTGQVLRVDGGM